MQIVSDEMIKYLPADILSNVTSDRVKEIKEGKTLFARWCKSLDVQKPEKALKIAKKALRRIYKSKDVDYTETMLAKEALTEIKKLEKS